MMREFTPLERLGIGLGVLVILILALGFFFSDWNVQQEEPFSPPKSQEKAN